MSSLKAIFLVKESLIHIKRTKCSHKLSILSIEKIFSEIKIIRMSSTMWSQEDLLKKQLVIITWALELSNLLTNMVITYKLNACTFPCIGWKVKRKKLA